MEKKENHEIDDFIWEYFKDKNQNMVSIPKGITSKQHYYRWKERKATLVQEQFD